MSTDHKCKHTWEFSIMSFFKLIFACGLVYVFIETYKLWMIGFLGILLAVTLEPLVQFFVKIRLSRGAAIATVAITLGCLIGLVSFIVVPSTFDQMTLLINALPTLKEKILLFFPADGPYRTTANQVLYGATIPDASVLMAYAVSLLSRFAEGASQISLILIFSIYLLADGKRAFKWITDFFDTSTRLKMELTAREASPVIFSYVMGQIVTCFITGVIALCFLVLLKVPGALTLSVLAGVSNLIPILGFFIAVVPAAVLALTVSPVAAGLIVLTYLVSHMVQNYILIPHIYGTSMKLSALVILVTLLVAGSVGGVLAAICVLPLVASYPIIERIWLTKYLGRHIVSKHAEAVHSKPLSEQAQLWSKKLSAPNGSQNAMPGRQMFKIFGRKILIVEDDDDIRSLLKDILEVEGYGVLSASNGREGLDILKRNSGIGLILLDMNMPVMNGRAFLDKVLNLPSVAGIPVVFLSATTDLANTEGSVDVLRKPSDINIVLEIVDRHYRSSDERPITV